MTTNTQCKIKYDDVGKVQGSAKEVCEIIANSQPTMENIFCDADNLPRKFRYLGLKCHPDSKEGITKDLAEKAFKNINYVYHETATTTPVPLLTDGTVDNIAPVSSSSTSATSSTTKKIGMFVDCKDCDTVLTMPWACIKIFGIVLIFVGATLFVFMQNTNVEKLATFMYKHKCNPLCMPFIGMIHPGTSTYKNFEECLHSKSKIFFTMLSQPIVAISNSVLDGMHTLQQSVKNLNTGTNNLGSALSTHLDASYTQVSESEAIMTYVMFKIKAIIDKIGAFVLNLYYILVSVFDFTTLVIALPDLIMTVLKFIFICAIILLVILIILGIIMMIRGVLNFGISIAVLPIPFVGGVLSAIFNWLGVFFGIIWWGFYISAMIITIAFTIIYGLLFVPLNKLYTEADRNSYCCFPSSTNLILADGTLKSIRHIHNTFSQSKVPICLWDNIKVIGCLEIYSNANDWYRINHTMVAGEHLIFDMTTRTWKKVKECGEKCDQNDKQMVRYCLLTDKHVFWTEHYNLFQDYQELPLTETIHIEQSQQILNVLNGNKNLKVNEMFEIGEQGKGLLSDTMIHTTDGTQSIQSIQIGQELEDGNMVMGVCKLLIGNVWFMKVDDIMLPCHMIIKQQDKGTKNHSQWNKVYNLNASQNPILFDNTTTGYNLITTKGYFTIGNGVTIRDFVEFPCFV